VVKILSWNLNHRTLEKPIPDTVVDVFRALAPDLILLNEFVDGPSRTSFRTALCGSGWVYQQVSATPGRHNQVFAAANIPIHAGQLEAPRVDGSALSNFLHLRLEEQPFEVVGFRVPMYKKAADRNAYWAELLRIMREAHNRPIAFIGDLNRDPFARTFDSNATSLRFPDDEAYQLPNPLGSWSYINMRGTTTSRLDHVLHTDALEASGASYITQLGGLLLAGPHNSSPISDHAALVFTLNARDLQMPRTTVGVR
jgi:endonuclease/exonuclease/phosphatase family metal-dependent hydrolase